MLDVVQCFYSLGGGDCFRGDYLLGGGRGVLARVSGGEAKASASQEAQIKTGYFLTSVSVI